MLSTAMRAPVDPGQLDFRTVYDVCLFRTTSVLDQNNGSRVEFLLLATRLLFLINPCSSDRRLESRCVLLPIGPARPSAHVAGWPARTAIAL